MIDQSPLESVKSDICVEFDDEIQSKIVYESILLEFETAENLETL